MHHFVSYFTKLNNGVRNKEHLKLYSKSHNVCQYTSRRMAWKPSVYCNECLMQHRGESETQCTGQPWLKT